MKGGTELDAVALQRFKPFVLLSAGRSEHLRSGDSPGAGLWTPDPDSEAIRSDPNARTVNPGLSLRVGRVTCPCATRSSKLLLTNLQGSQ